MSVWAEVATSGVSAALGAFFGVWYHARRQRPAPPQENEPEPVGPPPQQQRERFLTGQQGVYEDFFAASSAAFMAVGNYQMASRRLAALREDDDNFKRGHAARDDLGHRAEQAVERVRAISYRLEMRTAPREVVDAVREYAESLNGILEQAWIPAEMHLSEERVRRLMRADLAFDSPGSDDVDAHDASPGRAG